MKKGQTATEYLLILCVAIVVALVVVIVGRFLGFHIIEEGTNVIEMETNQTTTVDTQGYSEECIEWEEVFYLNTIFIPEDGSEPKLETIILKDTENKTSLVKLSVEDKDGKLFTDIRNSTSVCSKYMLVREVTI